MNKLSRQCSKIAAMVLTVITMSTSAHAAITRICGQEAGPGKIKLSDGTVVTQRIMLFVTLTQKNDNEMKTACDTAKPQIMDVINKNANLVAFGTLNVDGWHPVDKIECGQDAGHFPQDSMPMPAGFKQDNQVNLGGNSCNNVSGPKVLNMAVSTVFAEGSYVVLWNAVEQ